MSYPEHDKLTAVAAETQAAGEFIDWLTEQGYVLAKHNGTGDYLYEAPRSLTALLADWKEIDQDKLEAEKRRMLEVIRHQPGNDPDFDDPRSFA